MPDYLFQLPRHNKGTLQARIQEMLVDVILAGQLPPNSALPSSRKLAKQLNVARNTVVYAYQNLVDEGFVVSKERSGFYVQSEVLKGRFDPQPKTLLSTRHRSHTPQTNWSKNLPPSLSTEQYTHKPLDWHRYDYPFIYGQFDPKLFPIAHWRECCREAVSLSAIHDWAKDHFDYDNPDLVHQIISKLLPRRGVFAHQDEVLVTLGAQHGIYLAAQLLVSQHWCVGLENPGYVDARNIFRLFTSNIVNLDVDQYGINPDDPSIANCRCLYITPSHQYPTTVTLPEDRRIELLKRADRDQFLIIEDDYESEFNYVGEPTPALKSLDQKGTVIYVGSLSKTLAPGLRIGYMVAPRDFINQARALRRLMLRHPPANNQYIVARFLKLGYHDALVRRLTHTLNRRWKILGQLVARHFPKNTQYPAFGGSSYWIEGPTSLDTTRLAQKAARCGLLFEPGNLFFNGPESVNHCMRLGFSSISTDKIEPGFSRLIQLIEQEASAVKPTS